jgi:neurotransmitter:Na+ symporter, NSS family
MSKKERWATRIGLVLAMAGNAVGLGNFLRFPAQAGQNGGGAFLIPYLVALLIVGLPLIWVEWAMGRYGGQHGHHSAPGIFQSMGKSRLWKYAGVLGLWSCLVIASYYLYIESWCLAYAGYSLVNGFASTEPATFFGQLTGEQDTKIFAISGWGMGIFAVCITVNIFILSRGLARGIELVCKVGMPLLIVFAAILAVRGLMIQPTDPDVYHDPVTGNPSSPMEGLNFVWQPTFKRLTDPAVWLAAAGQIFFTLSIGMGTILCYASYLREKDDVALTGASAAWTNEFCEVVLGGTILIPIAVAYLGLAAVQEMTAKGSGFQLGFMVFPTLFNKWGAFAPVAGFLWFGLLFFAAITSSLAMGQPVMAFFQAEYGASRPRSAILFALLLLCLAVPVAIFHGDIFNGEFDYWAGTFGLVIFAVIEVILFAWVFGIGRGWDEINRGADIRVPRLFHPIIRYATPVFLLVILAAYVFKPAPDWGPYIRSQFSSQPLSWQWDGSGFIGKLMHKDLDEKIQKIQDDQKKPEEKKQEEIQFNQELKFWRNVDRLVLVGVFVFLSGLVFVAWRKKHSSEGVPT